MNDLVLRFMLLILIGFVTSTTGVLGGLEVEYGSLAQYLTQWGYQAREK